MPCVDRNGNIVPGAQGMCPTGSTWYRANTHPNAAEIEASKIRDIQPGSHPYEEMQDYNSKMMKLMNIKEGDLPRTLDLNTLQRKPIMDKPEWMPDWGVDAGLVAAGLIGRGGGGNKKSMMEALKRLGGRLGNLYKNPLKKNVKNPVQYKNVKPKWNPNIKLTDKKGNVTKGQWEFQGRRIDPKTWNKGKGVNSSKRVRVGQTKPAVTREWSPLRVGATGLGAAYMGGTALMDKMNQPEKRFMSTAEQYQQTAGQQAPPKELSDWEKQFAKFKDPKFWTESISGLPHDSRMHRMGMLMDYYGRTPKQRAAVDTPAEVWSRNEAEAQKNQTDLIAAQIKAKNDAMTFLSKISDKTQQAALRKDVEEKLDAGFIGGIPFFNPDESEIDEAVAEVALNIQNLMQTRDMSYPNARELVLNAFTK